VGPLKILFFEIELHSTNDELQVLRNFSGLLLAGSRP
jgi:hypothetical protein